MNLPKYFPELQKLREIMDARTEPDIDFSLRVVGVNLTQDNFKIKDGVPIVKNRKVALFLPDVWQFRKDFNGADPKYHVVHCNVVQKMQERGTYRNLSSTRRSDGKFPVKLSDGNELSLTKLVLCQPCLDKLRSQYGWNVFHPDPKKFPLEDWFEPFFYSSDDWKARSQTCRESANWTCQECNINLESDQHLLHTHHKWGTKYDNPIDLIALCIGCHSKQPGDGHQMLKYYPDYDEFMTKYG